MRFKHKESCCIISSTGKKQYTVWCIHICRAYLRYTKSRQSLLKIKISWQYVYKCIDGPMLVWLSMSHHYWIIQWATIVFPLVSFLKHTLFFSFSFHIWLFYTILSSLFILCAPLCMYVCVYEGVRNSGRANCSSQMWFPLECLKNDGLTQSFFSDSRSGVYLGILGFRLPPRRLLLLSYWTDAASS